MTREQELQQLQDFIEKNGVTTLPKDERGPDFMGVVFSAWGKPKKKKAKKKKATAKKKKG